MLTIEFVCTSRAYVRNMFLISITNLQPSNQYQQYCIFWVMFFFQKILRIISIAFHYSDFHWFMLLDDDNVQNLALCVLAGDYFYNYFTLQCRVIPINGLFSIFCEIYQFLIFIHGSYDLLRVFYALRLTGTGIRCMLVLWNERIFNEYNAFIKNNHYLDIFSYYKTLH